MNIKSINLIQSQLEYEFKQPVLLQQAFTRKSYSVEHSGTYDNEVLEFYGDKALEFVVMKKLSEYFGEITNGGKYASRKTEGQLTEVKKRLVCKDKLAQCIDVLDFADCLLMGRGDEVQNAQNQESVKEDLFEAIIGAVAIDCGWNAEILEKVVERMIDIKSHLENESDDENEVVILKNVVGVPTVAGAINQLQELFQKKMIEEPKHTSSQKGYDKNGRTIWYCSCSVGEKSCFAYNSSAKQGKKLAAYSMLCDILGEEQDYEA